MSAEHTAIVIMASTASTVAVAMEVIAALGACFLFHYITFHSLIFIVDLFYDIKLNPAVAIFQIFASQMIGYGIAGLRELFDDCFPMPLTLTNSPVRNLLVYPT